MIKSLLQLVILFFWMPLIISAQENINMIETLNISQDIVTLENRITQLIKNNPKISHIQGLRQYHVFWLKFADKSKIDTTKEMYLNKTFLLQLIPTYYKIGSNFSKEKEYLSTFTLITDSLGNLVAVGDAISLSVTPRFLGSSIELAKMFFDKKIYFVFNLETPFVGSYNVGIKENYLFALDVGGLSLYPWEDFIAHYFDRWLKVEFLKMELITQ
jgi:hypothetical protein